MLNFLEQPTITNKQQITIRPWHANPTHNDQFVIVCMKLSDLQNMRAGTVNFIGDTKPKFGTLEELTEVYLTSWKITGVGANATTRTRPIVGNYRGGSKTFNEAVQLCNDVWRARARYRTSGLLIQ
jgi:hypothetical protein